MRMLSQEACFTYFLTMIVFHMLESLLRRFQPNLEGRALSKLEGNLIPSPHMDLGFLMDFQDFGGEIMGFFRIKPPPESHERSINLVRDFLRNQCA